MRVISHCPSSLVQVYPGFIVDAWNLRTFRRMETRMTTAASDLPDGIRMRSATNADRDAIVEHIDRIYREYGYRICLEDSESDLNDIETNYPADRAAFCLFEEDGKILGTLAVIKVAGGQATFRRLYLAKDQRGGGLGDSMIEWGQQQAIEFGCSEIVFWSDTKFTRAHAFFCRHGFAKGEVRDMDDGYEPYQEYRFSKRLVPV